MDNTLLDDKLNEEIMLLTACKRKHEFIKFMNKNKKTLSTTIPYKQYNFSLFFYSSLHALSRFYTHNPPNNFTTINDIINYDEFDAYYESLPGIPDFLLFYLLHEFLRTISGRYPSVSLGSKAKKYLDLIKEDMLWYFNDYYKNNYDLFYKDIIKLSKTLFNIKHPLMDNDKMEFLFGDITTTFILDRGNIESNRTFSPKYQKDIDAIKKSTLIDMVNLSFVSYTKCHYDSGKLTYPLSTYLASFKYYNIPIVLKYLNVLFENQTQQYQYMINSIKMFNYYFGSLKDPKRSAATQKLISGNRKARKMLVSTEDEKVYNTILTEITKLLNSSSLYEIEVSQDDLNLIRENLSQCKSTFLQNETVNALARFIVAGKVIKNNKHSSSQVKHVRARI